MAVNRQMPADSLLLANRDYGLSQVLLVGGWAQPELALKPLRQQLSVFGRVQTLILDQPEALLRAQITDAIYDFQGKTLAVGWSLGGHLLMRSLSHQSTLRNPQELREKLAGVAFIACNPCFIGDDCWPGVGEAMFAQFEEQLKENAFVLLKKFFKLQLLGDPHCRELLRALEPAVAKVEGWSLEQLSLSLQWLRYWDCRNLLQEINGISFFLGRHDRLVPRQLEGVLTSQNPQHQVVCIDNMAHYPHAAAAATIVRHILAHNSDEREQK